MQGVGGSNPLAPTTYSRPGFYVTPYVTDFGVEDMETDVVEPITTGGALITGWKVVSEAFKALKNLKDLGTTAAPALADAQQK